MSYDPQARRDTALALKLKQRIRSDGPMSVADYMQACLHDPEHGYYVKQPAIGRDGDFITAPEISQIFGELIGLWSAVVWQQMGSPARINLVELGPGRGTLMRDALRAAQKVPGFLGAIDVHLVESNLTLQQVQMQSLSDSGRPISFHDNAGKLLWGNRHLGSAPAIVIGNEFLDTFGIHQFVFSQGSWRAREVGLNEAGQLDFVTDLTCGYRPKPLPITLTPNEGDIFEGAVTTSVLAKSTFAACAQQRPFAALLIDYGHAETSFGDTLQAVASHQAVSPFLAPGETDLTVHVDFEQFARACAKAEGDALAVDGPITQGEFLGRLGLVERASHLMGANPAKAGEIELAVARLIAPQGMGSRFKVIGLRSPNLPNLPGFE